MSNECDATLSFELQWRVRLTGRYSLRYPPGLELTIFFFVGLLIYEDIFRFVCNSLMAAGQLLGDSGLYSLTGLLATERLCFVPHPTND